MTRVFGAIILHYDYDTLRRGYFDMKMSGFMDTFSWFEMMVLKPFFFGEM